MYASVEHAPAGQKEQKTLAGVAKKMWRVMLVIALYWLLQWGSADLMGAFLRSLVVCGAPAPVDGICPSGSQPGELGICEAVPKSSRDWSGSAGCADKAFVVAKGTARIGKVMSLGNLAMIVAQVFVGAAMLDTLGRKPVALMGLGSATLLTGTLWFSCHLPSDLAMTVVLLGVLVSKLADSFMAAATAAISDLAQGDAEWQGLGFAMANILRHAGIVVAFGAGFPVLSLYLEDYHLVWVSLLLLCCLCASIGAVVLRETAGVSPGHGALLEAASSGAPSHPGLPEPKPVDQLEKGPPEEGATEGPETQGSAFLAQDRVPKSLRMDNAMAEAGIAFQLVWKDPFLRGAMAVCFLNNCAIHGTVTILGGYGLEVVKLRQQVVSLAGIAQPIAVVLGSLVATKAFSVLGEIATYTGGLLVSCGGFVIIALAAHFHMHAIECFWLGIFVCGIGFGMAEPAYMKLLSHCVEKQNYGKVYSAKMFMEYSGISFGAFVWSNFIFAESRAGTWQDGLCLLASAGVQLLVIVGMLFLRLSYWR